MADSRLIGDLTVDELRALLVEAAEEGARRAKSPWRSGPADAESAPLTPEQEAAVQAKVRATLARSGVMVTPEQQARARRALEARGLLGPKGKKR